MKKQAAKKVMRNRGVVIIQIKNFRLSDSIGDLLNSDVDNRITCLHFKSTAHIFVGYGLMGS